MLQLAPRQSNELQLLWNKEKQHALQWNPTKNLAVLKYCEILTLLVTDWRALGEGGLGVSGTVAAFSVQPDACTPPPEDLRLGTDSTPSSESLASSKGPKGLKVAFLAASTRLGLALDISGRELAEDAALLVAISRTAAAQQLEPASYYGVPVIRVCIYVNKGSPWKHYRSRDQNGRR